ncbi:restriction endonuclease [Sphingobacterium zeae]|uniref:restriction endonuclease n=1 Tax=Sphingobacterium zeae TaxID=1776859 RepID=UPI003608F3F6
MKKTGKEYEKLIETLYRQLAPNAIVTPNDSIVGRDSEVKRQIDVSIRYKYAEIEHLIIIEAKDFNKPVNVKAIEGFASVIKEVGANKGVLISAKGFSQAAKNFGKNRGIECLTVHSALNKNWETEIKVRVKKVTYSFDFNFDLAVEVVKGDVVLTKDLFFTYDNKNIVSFEDILDREVFSKYPLEQIRKQKRFFVHFNKVGINYLLGNKVVPSNTVVEFIYIKRNTEVFTIFPDDYIFTKNHLNESGTLNNMTISIDLIHKIVKGENIDFDITDDLGDYDLEMENLNLKDQYHLCKIKFNTAGGVTGDLYIKDDVVFNATPDLLRRIERERKLSDSQNKP